MTNQVSHVEMTLVTLLLSELPSNFRPVVDGKFSHYPTKYPIKGHTIYQTFLFYRRLFGVSELSLLQNKKKIFVTGIF